MNHTEKLAIIEGLNSKNKPTCGYIVGAIWSPGKGLFLQEQPFSCIREAFLNFGHRAYLYFE
ncbi:hypothetical protein SELR_pSRC600290 (plasmid) [Selenomonas ruminantium subsp. lactilytica TAM6421]|uniref:Uncharacterized protein n=1 Tax=Selenomonas ruminantium subsp. lactilytica (strain NBRC 103574 / TAM6421) TaxID=927704 RepID=I0GVJ4_SELRL|nr:hypothetical protein SELR_pSRC600290 [Selenomonas ruminantium subsp. lactilytica TAM6421]